MTASSVEIQCGARLAAPPSELGGIMEAATAATEVTAATEATAEDHGEAEFRKEIRRATAADGVPAPRLRHRAAEAM